MFFQLVLHITSNEIMVVNFNNHIIITTLHIILSIQQGDIYISNIKILSLEMHLSFLSVIYTIAFL